MVTALNQKDTEGALSAVAETTKENVNMKLFNRLLLERVRAVMLLRNAPNQSEAILANFGEVDAEQLKTLAAEAGGNINSHLLLRLLKATQDTDRVAMSQLPLELAIVEICQK